MRTLTEISDEQKENFVNNAIIQQRYNLVSGQTFDQQFSKLSLESELLHEVSNSIFTLEKQFGSLVTLINQRAREIQTGNNDWNAKQALKYQHGDALVWNSTTNVYEYAVENPAIQIVKYAKALDLGGYVLMKVAKEGANGPEKLTASELAAFTAYMNHVKFAGVQLTIVSRDADELKVYFNVYFDPLVMNANGSLISNPSVFPVEDAINNYNANLPFNAKFSITDQTDSIQRALGVVNPVFQSAEGRFGAQSYAPIVDYYDSNAGYMMIDPSFDLSTTITYTAAP